MKVFDWLLGRKYMEWDEYKQKMDDLQEQYWEQESQKKRFHESK